MTSTRFNQAVLFFTIVVTVAITGWWIFYSKPSWLFPYPPLEEVIWTSNEDFSLFFGPGTPQSAEVIARINQMKESNYLSENLRFRHPTLVTLAFLTAGTEDGNRFSADYPTVVSPFSPEIGQKLRNEHLQQNIQK